MKKRLLLALPLAIITISAFAQGKTTIIEMVDGQITDVQQVPNEPKPAFNSFQETDKNADGCVTASEAKLAGIMEFGRSDSNRDGCLNESEYYNAN